MENIESSSSQLFRFFDYLKQNDIDFVYPNNFKSLQQWFNLEDAPFHRSKAADFYLFHRSFWEELVLNYKYLKKWNLLSAIKAENFKDVRLFVHKNFADFFKQDDEVIRKCFDFFDIKTLEDFLRHAGYLQSKDIDGNFYYKYLQNKQVESLEFLFKKSYLSEIDSYVTRHANSFIAEQAKESFEKLWLSGFSGIDVSKISKDEALEWNDGIPLSNTDKPFLFLDSGQRDAPKQELISRIKKI